MLLYLAIIITGVICTSTLNILFNPLYHDKPWLYIVFTVALTIIVILIDGVVAFAIRKMPEKWFQEDKWPYHTTEREMKFYNFLKVRKWKDHVPELGSFTGFHKDKVADPFNNEYISRFILEARYGVLIHYVSFLTSFLILLLDWKMYIGQSNLWLTIALPVAIINAILIVLPAFILKYNLPRLLKLYERNKRIETKAKTALD